MTTLALLVLTLVAPARHVTLELYDKEAKLATVEWREQISDKGKVVTLDYHQEKTSKEVLRKRQITYDLEGIRVKDEAWARMSSIDATKSGAKPRPIDVHITTILDKEFTAQQTLKMGRKTTTASYPLPNGNIVLDPSQYWFFKDQPEKDKEILVCYYDPFQNGWHGYLKKFTGKKSMDAAGRRVDANVVEVSRDGVPMMEYYDDEGLPLILEDGDRRMIRKW